MIDPTPESNGESITLHELLEQSTRSTLKLQRKDGSVPSDRDSVSDVPETPVRTTSHWLTALSKVYEITGEEVFANAAHDATDYLLSDEARPYGYTFHSRNVDGKDKCDGLVGQAAPIRGLTHAGNTFNRPELLNLVEKIHLLHPYDSDIGLWQRREIDGDVMSIDRTLNHQVLFAAANADLAEKREKIASMLCQHLEGLKKNLRTRSNGLIRHFVRPPLYYVIKKPCGNPKKANLILNEFMFHIYSCHQTAINTEIGYHAVNLDALARLKQLFPNHSIWSDSDIRLAIAYIQDETVVNNILTEPRGSTIPGIRLARAFSVFCNDKEKAKSVLQSTINDIFLRDGNDKKIKVRNLSSLGKLVGLPNYQLKISP